MCSLHYQRRLKGRDMDAPIPMRANTPWSLSCKHPGCDRPSTSKWIHSYCGMHYQRHKNGKDMDRKPLQAGTGNRAVPGYKAAMSAARRAAGGVCAWCGATERNGARIEIDHMHPISKGGCPISQENLQALCYTCHKDKTALERNSDAVITEPITVPSRQMELPLTPMRSAIICRIHMCTRPARTRGLCEAHYHRMREGRDMYAPVRPRRSRHTPAALCIFDGCDRHSSSRSYCATHYQQYMSRGSADALTPIRLQRKPRRRTLVITSLEVD